MRLAVCVVGGVLLLAGCAGDDQKPLIAAGKAAVVRGALVPDVHLFGEPVVAQIDVIVNREQVDPADVRLKTDFKPYEVVGRTQETREHIGRFTRIRYRTTLRCLNEDCIPRTVGNVTISQTPGLPLFPEAQQRDEKRKYEFPPAVVTAEAQPKDKTLGRVVWSPLRSVSRINWYDSSVVGQGFPFVATVTPLAEPSYRISPMVLGLGLLALALALLTLPAWLLWERRRRHATAKTSAAPSLSPLERALRLVEWASRRPSVDERREALEVLAHELEGQEHDDEQVKHAREQGWSPPPPASEEMTELVSTIRESDAPAT
jgi:hypothetical protein